MVGIGRRALDIAAALVAMAALAAVGAAVASAKPPAHPVAHPDRPSGVLTSFSSDKAFEQFLASHERRGRRDKIFQDMAAPPPPSMAATAPAPATAVAEVMVTAAKRSQGITNNQEANVDEGDIVKAHGDVLVILHRGRLHTVSIARGGMRPVAEIAAYPPGVDASGDWYDEMLVSGDRVVVIGYSYSRGGTQIDRFHIDGQGHLTFEDAYQLRSNDYYSARNYASRLVGARLIVYTPLDLRWGGRDLTETLPAMRRWSGRGEPGAFKRIVGARDIYIPEALRDDPDAEISTLHSIYDCDLAAETLRCKGISVLGPESRNFYVSEHAVYVWLTDSWRTDRAGRAPAFVYRLPLDASAPAAVGAHGAPEDQFSFREDPKDGVLNVLVRSQGGGDGMWRSRFAEGAVALARIPLSDFGDGDRSVAARNYRLLPRPKGDGEFQNRFIGPWVLYGTGGGWDGTGPRTGAVVVAPLAGGPATSLPLAHGVDRLEVIGGDGLVVGGDDKNLTFTSIDLAAGAKPRIGDSYILPSASQGESRSHAFFYNPDPASADGRSGVMALPVARQARPEYRQLFETSASMLFLRRQNRRLGPLGELAAHEEGAVDDGCVASCVDWYGNARPIFIDGRTFALLGYELVEGRADGGVMHELGRVRFAPTAAKADRAAAP